MTYDLDLIKIHKELSKVDFSSDGSKTFEVNTFEDYCTFSKCNQLGFFEYRVKNSNSIYGHILYWIYLKTNRNTEYLMY